MSKKKLNLGELKVKSFITESNLRDVNTIKGGRPPKSNRGCDSGVCGPPDEPNDLSIDWCSSPAPYACSN